VINTSALNVCCAGKELEFYAKQMQKKKQKSAGQK
jgi:hypothetical protein